MTAIDRLATLTWLGEASCHETGVVGPKAANLSRLAALHRVPPGFAITAEAASPCQSGEISSSLALAVERAYRELSERCGEQGASVAVRSSAIDEDGGGASFAGQHDTYLNIRGTERVLDAVVRCARSARTEEALAYRQQHGLSLVETKIAVLVQALVRSDVSAVVFSANPVTGSRDEIMINASWGLGESIVGGTVTPDTYVVDKERMTITSSMIAKKLQMTVLDDHGTREVPVPRMLQDQGCLTGEQVKEMAELALRLESHFGWHADIECAFAAKELYLLQCRPITTLG